MKKNRVTLSIILWLMSWFTATSQPTLQNNYSYSMQVPSVIAMESSQAHLYVLSQSEGMAVFRTRADSLQWLYTSGGMQRRGNTINADIRFAYLFGDSRRLTVLEPTSVFGAYSSTDLPAQPLNTKRLDENLYVVLGSGALGKLDLKTPESLDSDIEIPELRDKTILDIEASSNKFYALSDDATLFTFTKTASGITLHKKTELDEDISRFFFMNESLMGTNNDGDIYQISSAGSLNRLGGIGESVAEIKSWNDWLIVKGSSNRLWSSYQLREPTLWKENRDAGNYLAVSKGQLWISEYDRISRITEGGAAASVAENTSNSSSNAMLEIKPIADQVIPYPNSLLLPLQLKGNFPPGDVQFSLQTNVKNAVIRGQSLYWRPQSNDAGLHRFRVITSSGSGQTSTASFTVDVRSFNSPPRFTPLRTISIPSGQPFSLPVKAFDSDATDKNLIRYLGVNLPNGATIDEQTGEFNWTPTARYEGENSFRVIATDQYGAASSQNVTIRVIDTGSRN